MSDDFEELEKEILQDNYQKTIEESQTRRLYVSNFLESKEQSKSSSLGGSMFSDSQSQITPLMYFKRNLKQLMVRGLLLDT